MLDSPLRHMLLVGNGLNARGDDFVHQPPSVAITANAVPNSLNGCVVRR